MTNPYRRNAPSPSAIRTAYGLTPSTSADTAHALQVLHGLSVRRIAMACRISYETLAARLNERVNFVRKTESCRIHQPLTLPQCLKCRSQSVRQ